MTTTTTASASTASPAAAARDSELALAPANGWTGGQYSLFRAIFGTYLFIHFAHLIPWGTELFSNRGALPDGSASPLLRLFPNVLALIDSPAMVTGMLVIAVVLSVLLAIGWWDRLAAIGLWYTWACLFGRNPLISNPGLPYVGLLLLAHAMLPRGPYGSLAARGRTDPRGSWFMPQPIFVVVWILMALGYSYSGYTKLVSPSWLDGTAMLRVLENPLARPTFVRDAMLTLPDGFWRIATWGALGLELAFAPLALISLLRPWLWLVMLLMHLGLMVLIDFADLSVGMVMLHLFTFNPAWVRPRPREGQFTIFYDGHCGLCHRWVRFVLSEDLRGDAFRFGALDSDAFRAAVDESRRASLPDSVVVVGPDGSIATRSAATLAILRRLGGAWRVFATICGLVPAFLRNAAYDFVARIRYRLFRRPVDACPMLPAELRERFLM